MNLLRPLNLDCCFSFLFGFFIYNRLFMDLLCFKSFFFLFLFRQLFLLRNYFSFFRFLDFWYFCLRMIGWRIEFIYFATVACIFLFAGFFQLNWFLIIRNQAHSQLFCRFLLFLIFVLKPSIRTHSGQI